MYVGKSGEVFVGQSVSSTLYMINSTFASNTGTEIGALLLDDLQCIALDGVALTGNQGNSAGGIFIQGTSADPALCASGVLNSTFGAKVAFQPLLFDPLASENGSVPSFLEPYNADLRHLTVSDNAGNESGGLKLLDNQQDVAVSQSAFSRNSASKAGAFAMSGISSLALKSCSFDFNLASSGNGAAVNFAGLSGHVSVADCDFTNNSAAGSGGGMDVTSTSLNIAGSSFRSNVGGLSGGGAILCRDCNRISIIDSTFDANSCTEFGGAIKATGVYAYRVILDRIQAINNRYVGNSIYTCHQLTESDTINKACCRVWYLQHAVWHKQTSPMMLSSPNCSNNLLH